MTAQLIPVFPGTLAGQPAHLVNGRDLHAFLEVGKVYRAWINERIQQYGFREGEDYLAFDRPESVDQTDTQRRGGDRRSKHHHLTLDMAKELAMVERTPKGREARRYFIRCEQALLAARAGQAAPADRPAVPPRAFEGLSASLLRELRALGDDVARAYLAARGVPEVWLRGERSRPVAPGAAAGGTSETGPGPMPLDLARQRIAQYADRRTAQFYLLKRASWLRACAPYDPVETARALRALGVLRCSRGRLTYKPPRGLFGRRRPNVYAARITLTPIALPTTYREEDHHA